MGREILNVSVEAIDGLNTSMATVPHANVVRRQNELGSRETVSWYVTPLPASGFPFSFSAGSKQQQLSQGTASYNLSFTTPRIGRYVVGVRTPTDGTGSFSGSAEKEVLFQDETNLLLETKGYNENAAETCVVNCPLPNNTFSVITNVTTYLNTTNLKNFSITLRLIDSAGDIVLGDSDAYIYVRFIKHPASRATVALTVPPAFMARDAGYYFRADKGRVTMKLGFTGSTAEPGSSVHNPVMLEFFCPEVVPWTVHPTGRNVTNPCYKAIPNALVSTLPIRVLDDAVSTSIF
eukprot:PhM_4_TR16787/c0_g1_i8/m.103482